MIVLTNSHHFNRIRQRAYALKEAREKARQEIANQKYDEQWRSSCDDARTLDSKSLELYMNQERLKQIQEKVQRKQRLSQQEDSYLQEWYRQLEELEKRDREKEELRRRIDQETSAALRAQVSQSSSLQYYNYMCNDMCIDGRKCDVKTTILCEFEIR